MKCRAKGYKNTDVEVRLKVNAKNIALNPFVQEFIYKAISGMVASLKGVGAVSRIELVLKKKMSHRKDTD